jgi:hypothetical protein
MHAHPKKEAVQPRWRAILRLAFGQTHVIGATAALVLLLQGGVSPRVKLKLPCTALWLNLS